MILAWTRHFFFFFLRRKLPDVGVSVDFHPCPLKRRSNIIQFSLSGTEVNHCHWPPCGFLPFPISCMFSMKKMTHQQKRERQSRRLAMWKESIARFERVRLRLKRMHLHVNWVVKKRLHASAPLGINPPANEKLYWLLLKAPGHSCWTLNFRGGVFFLPQSFWSVWLGGNQADLKLSSSFFRVFSSFQLPCTPFLYSWTFYPQLYLFSLAHYFLAFFFSPCSGPCFCQFHAGPVLGESPRALETIRPLLPLPKNRHEFFIINHLLFSLSQLKS